MNESGAMTVSSEGFTCSFECASVLREGTTLDINLGLCEVYSSG
jgi:hypothetical protein